MKKKLSVITILSVLLSVFPVFAATNDFTADGNITVTGITFGVGTTDMLIMNTSTAESWTFSSGSFTVTNPGTFRVGSSNASIKSIKVTSGGSDVACAENTTAGTSYVTLPTTSGTYTIVPLTLTDCTTLCASVSNAATYNSFPTCGAATCVSGYSLSGSGSTATCYAPSSGASSGGGGGVSTEQTYQTYDPITKELVVGDVGEEETTTSGESKTAGEPNRDADGKVTLQQMVSDAETVMTGDVNKIIAEMGVKRDIAAEAGFSESITAKIMPGLEITTQVRDIVNNFISYGTPATKALGAGERGGVVNSFSAAFGKAPIDADDWNDIIKIANGRWPSQRSEKAENNANISFKKIYLREPDRSNPHDDAAITVMAYGLRPAQRNFDSEKAAIIIFEDIYGYKPEQATDWDIVRTIAYSGAIR